MRMVCPGISSPFALPLPAHKGKSFKGPSLFDHPTGGRASILPFQLGPSQRSPPSHPSFSLKLAGCCYGTRQESFAVTLTHLLQTVVIIGLWDSFIHWSLYGQPTCRSGRKVWAFGVHHEAAQTGDQPGLLINCLLGSVRLVGWPWQRALAKATSKRGLGELVQSSCLNPSGLAMVGLGHNSNLRWNR